MLLVGSLRVARGSPGTPISRTQPSAVPDSKSQAPQLNPPAKQVVDSAATDVPPGPLHVFAQVPVTELHTGFWFALLQSVQEAPHCVPLVVDAQVEPQG